MKHNENTLAQAVVAACVAKAAKPPKRSKLPPPIVSSVMLPPFIFFHINSYLPEKTLFLHLFVVVVANMAKVRALLNFR